MLCQLGKAAFGTSMVVCEGKVVDARPRQGEAVTLWVSLNTEDGREFYSGDAESPLLQLPRGYLGI